MKKVFLNFFMLLLILLPRHVNALEDSSIVNVPNIDFLGVLVFSFPLLCLLISLIIWFMYGNNVKKNNIVEYYPPEGFNSLEIGYLYKGMATEKDVISLLIYLANKGYIKISESSDNSVNGKKAFKIIKLKDYDGNNTNERLFINGLFGSKNLVDSTTINNVRTEVSADKLNYDFYITIKKILNNINTKQNRNIIMNNNSLKKKVSIIIMTCISYLAISIYPMLINNISNLIFLFIFLSIIGFILIVHAIINKDPNIYMEDRSEKSPKKARIEIMLFGIILVSISWYFFVLPGLKLDSMYLIGYMVGIICIILMIILSKNFSKRTEYGFDLLYKIKGYREFLKTVSKEKIDTLANENPNYFYDILPYAYVLDVSDTWINKFESISEGTPNWYEGNEAFTVSSLDDFFGIEKDSNSSLNTENNENTYFDANLVNSSNEEKDSNFFNKSQANSKVINPSETFAKVVLAIFVIIFAVSFSIPVVMPIISFFVSASYNISPINEYIHYSKIEGYLVKYDNCDLYDDEKCDVLYEYTVDNVKYEVFSTLEKTDISDVKTIKYDPNNPSESFIYTGLPSFICNIILVILFIAILLVVIFITICIKKNKGKIYEKIIKN